jgi:DNA polymerase family A
LIYRVSFYAVDIWPLPLESSETASPLTWNWTRIRHRIISVADTPYNVFVPADRKEINPQSRLGSLILETAVEYGIDPHDLADAVETVHQEERDTLTDIIDARKIARQRTGLTIRKIQAWEDDGHDYVSWPGLDVIARELAGELPSLGIGQGYSSEINYEHIDHAVMLWGKLREEDPRIKPRHDPDILRTAAEMVYSAGGARRHFGPLRFSRAKFAEYLIREGIPWPRLESGDLALDDDTMKEMARAYPDEIGPLREALRLHRGELKRLGLTVGSDGRNRFLLSVFASSTGRNQPSNARSIFGPSAYLRSLIRPELGRAVAYVDWSAQELAIAASLSGDLAMQDAYTSGDPYLWFAQQAGMVPTHATKKTHATERDRCKIVMLGVLYGLSDEGIARRLSVQPCRGRELLQMHKDTFRRFWQWSDHLQNMAILTGQLQTVFGWKVHVGPNANPRSLRNFPMQANGAEMLRLACCSATEQGITVCAPIHDALLVEGPIDEIETIVVRTQEIMREAGKVVLGGFELRTDAKIVRYPDRYSDGRGRAFFEQVCALLNDLEREGTPSTGATPTPCTGARGPLAPVLPPSNSYFSYVFVS